MTSILIVEDEPPAARRLERLVQESLGLGAVEITLVQSLSAAQDELNAQSFDIICLDLNLAGEDGFKTLAHVRAKGAAVVVVSANLDRALEGFEHGVVDFVPKPVSAERFAVALARAQEALRNDTGPRLAIRRQGGVELILIGEIVSITGAGDYAEIRTIEGAIHLDDRNLSELEKLLTNHLLRVHRSHLVGLKFIRKLTKVDGQVIVVLEGGLEIPVARRAVAKVTAALPQLDN